MNLHLRSVRILSPGSAHHGQTRDIHITDGKIASVVAPGKSIPKGATVIECEGRCVSPGWFDLHVNFGEPGYEQREDLRSGTEAAAAGGFTGVLYMPSTTPPIQTKADVEFIRRRTEDGLVEVVPAGCLTVGREGKDLAELYDMQLSGAKAFTDDQHPVRNADVLLRALRYCKDFGARVMVLAEDKDIAGKGQMNEGPVSTRLGMKGIPALAESLMIGRDLQVLEYTGGRLHFSTVSTAEGVDLIRKAKKKGLDVTADVSVAHIFLNDEALEGFDSVYKVKPPLRGESDRLALIAGLADGTLDAVTTDHRPHDTEGKMKEFELAEFGMSGLETGFAILNSAVKGKISEERIAEILAVNPRRLLGLEVPVIEEGALANLTVYDPEKQWTVVAGDLRSRSVNNPFIGKSLTGKPVAVINRSRFQLI
jgi:dihydroorotase